MDPFTIALAQSDDRLQMKNSQSGMSLVEVLVGGVLAAIMVAALTAFIAHGSTLNTRDILLRRVYQELDRALSDTAHTGLSGSRYALKFPAGFTTATIYGPSPVSLYNSIQGTLVVDAARQTYEISGTFIPGILIKAKISYIENGILKTDSLSKIITYVRG